MMRLRRLLHLLRAEEGSATVEFAIVFPIFITLFLSSFEMGMLLTRQVMLDRGLDLAVREVRLGSMGTVTHDALKARICEGAGLIPDCLDELKLEMVRVDPRAWSSLGANPDCVDRENRGNPVLAFTPGNSNELMLLRACALFDPYFPTTGLGSRLPRMSGGAYGLLSTTAYVVEPI